MVAYPQPAIKKGWTAERWGSFANRALSVREDAGAAFHLRVGPRDRYSDSNDRIRHSGACAAGTRNLPGHHLWIPGSRQVARPGM